MYVTGGYLLRVLIIIKSDPNFVAKKIFEIYHYLSCSLMGIYNRRKVMESAGPERPEEGGSQARMISQSPCSQVCHEANLSPL